MFYIMKNVILTKIFAIYTLSLILSLQITYSIHQTQKNNVQLLDLSKNYIPYNLAWEYQKRLLQYHMNQQAMSSTPLVGSLLVLQHSPVFTLGTGTQTDSGPFHDKIEDENGSLVVSYDTIKVERAGQATYHGPGQLVLYPILDLNYFKKDINLYLRNLEQIVINTCADYDIKAGRVDGQTGVWIDNNVKISAIGIKLRRWVTMHGISVNVNPNLRHFANIIPCGITDKRVGSLAQYAPHVTINEVYSHLLKNFKDVFDVDLVAKTITDTEVVTYLESLPHSSCDI